MCDLIWLQWLKQDLVKFLDIYWYLQKENRPESQNYEMIAYLTVWYLGAVLAKSLDLYWESYMELYLDNILECGSKVEAQKAVMVEYSMVYHLGAVLSKYLRSELIMAMEMVWH